MSDHTWESDSWNAFDHDDPDNYQAPVLVKVEFESIEKQTEKAILFATKKYGKVWVPKSQIKSELLKESKSILVPTWLSFLKGKT